MWMSARIVGADYRLVLIMVAVYQQPSSNFTSGAFLDVWPTVRIKGRVSPQLSTGRNLVRWTSE
jgi:hypothetical protein